jgi:hypothetical protein
MRRIVVCFINVRPRITDSMFTALTGNTLRTLPEGQSAALQVVLANCTNLVTGLTNSLMRQQQLCNDRPQLSLQTKYNFCARISNISSVSEGRFSFCHHPCRTVIKANINTSGHQQNTRGLVRKW